jgi:hypothetical protein
LIHIRKIETTRRKDVQKFVLFPFDLYKNDPRWVPPLIKDVKLSLDRERHPFYKHAQADFFVAEQDGQVLGRIAAIDNQHYKAFHDDEVGFLYYFEVVENVVVAQALFEAVFDWSRQRGLKTVIGPKGLLQGDGLGLLIEGFEFKPAMGIPYNPVYYVDFFKRAGFKKKTDYLSGYLTKGYELDDRIRHLAEKVKKRRGYRVKRFENKAEMRAWIPEFRNLYNRAFRDVPNTMPVSEDEINLLAERILSIAHPKLIKFIFQRDQMVGFLFSYHNISDGLQKAGGRMWPFGWYHLMRAFRETRWVDFNGIGLLPEHQGVGVTAILYTELAKSIKEFPFEKADFVQVADVNFKSFNEMDHLGVTWHKRHRLYKKALE